MPPLEITTLIISVVALTLSLFSFWNNTVSPFRIKVHNDAPTFYLDEINYPDRKWWIPGFDIELSIYNMGARAGEILDIRIVATVERDEESEKFFFYSKWIVNHSEFNKSENRAEWIKNAIIRDWYPLVLRDKSEEHIRLILEDSRWEEPKDYPMTLSLEIATSRSDEWKTYRTYDLFIPEEIFSTGDTYTPMDKKMHELRAKK